jgi:uncharacterized protein YndB with AHSA1/START domain
MRIRNGTRSSRIATHHGETSLVEREIRIAARPETVFEYFTDPAKMVRWMGIEATLDPRPGGVFRVNVIGAAPVVGEYVALEPVTRIVFTWVFEERVLGIPPQATEVEVHFTPDGDETIVHVSHRKLPGSAASLHHAGWEHYLDRLAVAAWRVDVD